MILICFIEILRGYSVPSSYRRINIMYIYAGENEDEDKLIPNFKSSDKRRITIERTLFTQTRFNELFKPGPRPQQTLYQRTRRKVTKYVCSGSQKCCRVFLFNLFPFLTILKDYNIKRDIPGDIVAGFTVGIMHIPQGKLEKYFPILSYD